MKQRVLGLAALALLVSLFILAVRSNQQGQVGGSARKPGTDQGESDDPIIKRKLTVIQMIWMDLEREEPGSLARKEFLREFMAKSNEYLNTIPSAHSTVAGVWTLRAVAACELNLREEARKAGKKMLELGLDKSDQKFAIRALAFLERKGWLHDDVSIGGYGSRVPPASLNEHTSAATTRERVDHENIDELRRYLQFARGGNERAQRILTDTFWDGTDPGTLEMNSNQGNGDASFVLGLMYEFKWQNEKEAYRLYGKAADRGTSRTRTAAKVALEGIRQ